MKGLKSERSLISEIEIPIQLYKLLLKEAAETGLTVEENAKLAFRNYIERNGNFAD